ncbi:RNA ligase RtcB family protein [Thioclava sp. GXIMD4216]|uniref:RNA ligase RtcB family protein n=1 Tax=Thioclava sp. GXIMD4216 TaxID=3131929 RepID=UPI0030CBB5BD
MGISFSGRTGRAPVRHFYTRDSWIDGRAEDQLAQVAGWSGMQSVAGFPDLHPGKFGPVGAAFLADRIYPQLVGTDIGCGMGLWRLDLPRRKLKLDKAAKRLEVLERGTDPAQAADALAAAGLTGQIGEAGLGTIGGGNHFCELQTVEETDGTAGLRKGDLCLLVHSGSRGYGAQIFDGLEDSWKAGFDPQSAAGNAYLALHARAVAWARLNRRLIAETAADALGTTVTPLCDSVHNSVVAHQGHWLHRKGAAEADRGLVPLAGSREAPSFLLALPDTVPEALSSVSHGAGRRYDRASMHGRIRKVRSELEALTRTRFGGRVICHDRDLLIEEAGPAYKAPEAVLADLTAFGLATPLARMVPLITYKTSGGQR